MVVVPSIGICVEYRSSLINKTPYLRNRQSEQQGNLEGSIGALVNKLNTTASAGTEKSLGGATSYNLQIVPSDNSNISEHTAPYQSKKEREKEREKEKPKRKKKNNPLTKQAKQQTPERKRK